jgi:hypothetical protein
MKASTAAAPDDEILDREAAARFLFGPALEEYGRAYLERDACGPRRVPFFKIGGARKALYRKSDLIAVKAEGLREARAES